MITDHQRDLAKTHGFKFYERQAGRAPSALESLDAEAAANEGWQDACRALSHLARLHPDFIAIGLLQAVAERQGGPAFREAVRLLELGFQACRTRVERMAYLEVVCKTPT
jgi:hypothetical protein